MSARKHTQIAVLWVFLSAGFLGGVNCAVVATRPVQEMSEAGSALKAAKDIEADKLAPELYRKASETYQMARRQYKLKNFMEARDLALKARGYAEKAEFISMQSGGVRQGPPPDPLENSAPKPDRADEYEKPQPTPFNPYGNSSGPSTTGTAGAAGAAASNPPSSGSSSPLGSSMPVPVNMSPNPNAIPRSSAPGNGAGQ